MKVTELYSIGIKAYNGDTSARVEWFAKLAPLAIAAAKPYEVLPSLVLAKAAIESGYASDLYEVEFYEPEFGVEMGRKATKHNNVIGMNAFNDNLRYLAKFPFPKWLNHKTQFWDYGAHYENGNLTLVKNEPWKHYESVEECFEDWCANIRYQASKNGKVWGMTIEEQLLAIESYTPEGDPAETPGMHYEWQDYVLYLYHDFGLGTYDWGVYEMGEKIAEKNLDAHIKNAYIFAHENCAYGPTNASYPPGDDGVIDCVGLVYRAFYTMGLYPCAMNIDQLAELCEKNGMIRSVDINDVWKHHAIVCFQDKNNVGTQHINHVYYSLGGKSASSISKYDLGSDKRIKSAQPFENVKTDEWADKVFLCAYLAKDSMPAAVEPFLSDYCAYARITKKSDVFSGAGNDFARVGDVKPGDNALSMGLVTGTGGTLYRAAYILPTMTFGYVESSAVDTTRFTPYNGIVTGTDGTLALRIGAGTSSRKITDIPEGETVKVDGLVKTKDGTMWNHVKWRGKRGYSAAMHIVRIKG